MSYTRDAIKNYAILSLIFFILTLVLPANPQAMSRYNLSASQYHVLLFIAELPLILIWFTAFYGYAKLQEYTAAIKDTPEASSYERLATGCKWLAWGLPIPALVSLLFNTFAARHAGLQPTATVFTNYFGLIFPIIAFSIMSDATQSMATQIKLSITATSGKLLQLGFIMIGVLYCFFTLRQLNATHNPYYLPVWLVIATIIVPYLYAWFIGFLAAYNMTQVAKKTPGILYKRALGFMANGIVIVIVSLIATQYLRSALPRTAHLSLSAAFMAVYIIYAVTAIGFVLLALGASRLKKIEEI